MRFVILLAANTSHKAECAGRKSTENGHKTIGKRAKFLHILREEKEIKKLSLSSGRSVTKCLGFSVIHQVEVFGLPRFDCFVISIRRHLVQEDLLVKKPKKRETKGTSTRMNEVR